MPRVVDQRVDAPVLGEHLSDQFLATMARRQILHMHAGPSPGVGYRASHGLGGARITTAAVAVNSPIVYGDVRAPGRQQPSVSLAQAAPGTSHDDHLSGEVNHAPSLPDHQT